MRVYKPFKDTINNKKMKNDFFPFVKFSNEMVNHCFLKYFKDS